MKLGGTPPRPVYEAIGIAELLYYRSANKVEKLAHLVVARLRAGGKLVLPHHRITFYDFAQHADAIHDRFLAATKRPWNCRTVRKTRRWSVQSYTRSEADSFAMFHHGPA